MILRFLSYTASVLFVPLVFAQTNGTELVRNGGFELVASEPKTYDQITEADSWKNVTIGFSELFSKSASAKTIGIPDNDYGHMDPQEGEHYAGFFAWKDDQRRSLAAGEDDFVQGWSAYSEYLTSELMQPLQEGKVYEITFWVSLSGNSDRAVSGLGAYFSAEALHFDHRRFLEQKPLVSVDAIVGEKSTWVQVKGSFEADGGERYITIGTFPAAGFDTKRLIEGLDNQYAYYYVDNISLKETK
ncbi:MAG: hypothetical protein IPO90_03500 [Flavobacteriales bacterium]|nr:hypothetical protein [Flavobacteriales bacterium]